MGLPPSIVVGTMIGFVYGPLRPNKVLAMRALFLQLSLLACSQAAGMDRNKTPGLGWSPRFSPGTVVQGFESASSSPLRYGMLDP